MPLFCSENINGQCVWGLWQITEGLPELYAQLCPNEHDNAYFLGISHDERQRQTVASRVLVQMLLAQWGDAYGGIVKDRTGTPLLAGQEHYVSVSHTEGFAAAMLHRVRPAGIDIEPVRDKMTRVVGRVLSADEWTASGQQPEKLCVYWCAKEAVYKCHSGQHLSLRDHIHIRDFDLAENGTLFGTVSNGTAPQSCTIHYHKIRNFIVAYTF